MIDLNLRIATGNSRQFLKRMELLGNLEMEGFHHGPIPAKGLAQRKRDHEQFQNHRIRRRGGCPLLV